MAAMHAPPALSFQQSSHDESYPGVVSHPRRPVKPVSIERCFCATHFHMTKDRRPVMPQQALFLCPEDPLGVTTAPPVTSASPPASFPWMSPVCPATQFLIHLMIHIRVDSFRYRVTVVESPPLDLRIQRVYQFLLGGRVQRTNDAPQGFEVTLDFGLAGLDDGLKPRGIPF